MGEENKYHPKFTPGTMMEGPDYPLFGEDAEGNMGSSEEAEAIKKEDEKIREIVVTIEAKLAEGIADPTEEKELRDQLEIYKRHLKEQWSQHLAEIEKREGITIH